jgi:toxin ParE1/3/4
MLTRSHWSKNLTPYRVIYRVLGNVVHVFLIADGRRDMQTLLHRRLLDD